MRMLAPGPDGIDRLPGRPICRRWSGGTRPLHPAGFHPHGSPAAELVRFDRNWETGRPRRQDDLRASLFVPGTADPGSAVPRRPRCGAISGPISRVLIDLGRSLAHSRNVSEVTAAWVLLARVRLRWYRCVLAFSSRHSIQTGQSPTVALQYDMGASLRWTGSATTSISFRYHSGGYELIACPEVFIAAAAERTTLRLGTEWFHALPSSLMVADRWVLLDLTVGRVMFGTGPGALPSDAMMGIDPRSEQRPNYVWSPRGDSALFRAALTSESSSRH